MVEAIGRIAGWKGTVVPLSRSRMPKHLLRDLDFRYSLALSSERIRTELGYSERALFEEGLQRTIDWERANRSDTKSGTLDYKAEDRALKESGRIERA